MVVKDNSFGQLTYPLLSLSEDIPRLFLPKSTAASTFLNLPRPAFARLGNIRIFGGVGQSLFKPKRS
jgi:hypothetical protein